MVSIFTSTTHISNCIQEARKILQSRNNHVPLFKTYMAGIFCKSLTWSLMVVNMTMTDYKTLQLTYGITKML